MEEMLRMGPRMAHVFAVGLPVSYALEDSCRFASVLLDARLSDVLPFENAGGWSMT